MKVSDAIKSLQEHEPDEEIVLMYWAKDIFDDEFDDDNNLITTELWGLIVEHVENWNYLDNPSSEIYDSIYRAIVEAKDKNE
jgi:hypothetical protein